MINNSLSFNSLTIICLHKKQAEISCRDGYSMKNLIQIHKYLEPDRIIDIISDNKDEALKELSGIICNSELITDPKLFLKKIYDREKLMSTGIGYGIAVPHIRDKSIQDFVIALGRKVEGLEYESIDNKPVSLIFMIGASDTQDKDYIRLLSRLVLRLKNRSFVQKLLSAQSPQDMYSLIKTQD
ncbi:MAG: PTS sugar transporter subunit IIA [Candidatus Cloacimonetes bacterium]|nr:PTS sugar transporter subunit IIA [Candidatus Cloacimonadota bacterium]